MSQRVWGPILGLVLVGCGGEPMETDTDIDSDTERPIQEGCDEVTVYVDGRDPPQVGDVWTVLLRCDGSTLTGPMVLRIDPTDLADLDENTLTFQREGEGTVRAQVGSFRATREVAVER